MVSFLTPPKTVIVCVTLGSILLVSFILWYHCELPAQACGKSGHDPPRPSAHIRTRRSLRPGASGTECLDRYGGIRLTYVKNANSTFIFDLCSALPCGSRNTSWRGYDLYLCGLGYPGNQAWCPTWAHVWQATNRNWNPTTHTPDGKLKTSGHFMIQRNFSPTQNPISLSISGLNQNPYTLPAGGCWDGKPNTFYILLGVDVSGKDPVALIRIDLENPPQNDSTASSLPTPAPSMERSIVQIDYSTLQPLDVIQMATGYKDDNLWLKWIAQTAREHSKGDCVACAAARPHLFTEPAPLHPTDTWGFGCMLNLTKMATPPNCTTLASIFPPIPNNTRSGPFTPRKTNSSYVWFNFTPSSPQANVGTIPLDWCNTTIPGSAIGPRAL